MCIIPIFANAQQDLSIYSLHTVPQSNYSNPGLMPKPGFHLGLPGASSIFVGIGNTGFNAHNVLETKNDTTFFKLGEFVNSLKDANNINLDMNLELFSFGFKVKKKHYFNFSVSTNFSTKFTYPKELFELIYKGNGAFLGEEVSFGNLGFRALHYNQAALGYTLKINDKLSVGARFKAIQGLASVETKKTDISLLTNEENFFITAKADVDVYTSVPGLNTIVQDYEQYSLLLYYAHFLDLITGYDPVKYFTNTSNRGYGIDLGFNYDLNEKLSFGASIVDFGSIKWKSDVLQFKSKNPGDSYTFEGIEQGELLTDTNLLNIDEQMQSMLDSVINIFEIDTILGGSYTTPLNTRFYFHTFYNVSKKLRLVSVLRLQFFQNKIYPKLQLGATQQIGNVLQLHANYTIDRNSFTNVGVGIATKLGPLQLYLTTDNILSGIFFNRYHLENRAILLPRNTKHMNLRLGFNLVFGMREKKPDKPLI